MINIITLAVLPPLHDLWWQTGSSNVLFLAHPWISSLVSRYLRPSSTFHHLRPFKSFRSSPRRCLYVACSPSAVHFASAISHQLSPNQLHFSKRSRHRATCGRASHPTLFNPSGCVYQTVIDFNVILTLLSQRYALRHRHVTSSTLIIFDRPKPSVELLDQGQDIRFPALSPFHPLSRSIYLRASCTDLYQPSKDQGLLK